MEWLELRLMKWGIRVAEHADGGRWTLIQFPEKVRVAELFQDQEGEMDQVIHAPQGDLQEALEETLAIRCRHANSRE